MPRRKKEFYTAPHRPLLSIDWDVVDRLLEAGCMGTEVAAHLGCCANTLYDRCFSEKGVTFSIYIQEKKQKGDSLLRSVQFKEAMKGDRGMLIWLGKNRLEQSDKLDTKNSSTVNLSIVNYGTNSKPETWAEKNDSDTKKP